MNSVSKFHVPVLLEESIDGLNIENNDVVIDGTFGGGGHSEAILKKFGESVELVCVDLDENALTRYGEIIGSASNATFVHSNFKDAEDILSVSKKKKVNKVLLDLGTSTFQLLQDTRGFSFLSDAPLSMAFSESGSHTEISAWDIANIWSEESIADIIYAYGEDRGSRKIAKAIVSARENGSIETASQLANIIMSAFKFRGKIHPATKTFQAFRVAVNDELNVLKEALENWWKLLQPQGRIAVITFHSLEDRIVKHWMKEKTNQRVITKKPITPNQDELKANPRSRSAKLRIIEKI